MSIMDIGMITFCLVYANSSFLNDVAKREKLEQPHLSIVSRTLKKRNVLEIFGLKASELSAVRVSIS
jgi:hypothetical protein